MSSEAAGSVDESSQNATAKVFSKALGLKLSSDQLKSGGLLRAVGGLFRKVWKKCVYVTVSSVGAVCSLTGLRSITAVNALVASVILGPDKALRLVGASVVVVAAVGGVKAAATAPDGDMSSEDFLTTLAQDDKSTWGSLLQLIDVFDKVTEVMPVLQNPRVMRLRDENPSEMFLRLLSLVYRHQASQHHSPPPQENQTKSQPRSAAAVLRADHYIISALRSLKDGETAAAAARKADAESEENVTVNLRGSAHQSQGSHAPSFLIHELRMWMEYAEAAYYKMSSEDQIDVWLQERGWQLLLASLNNSPHSPVHFVAVHPEKKQLLLSVRGTESISDAVTDMIMTPKTWGDKSEKVHSGIGETAEGLFNRVQHIATSFAASGHSVVLVGHSLGAGAVALLAWLLRERCGISQLRAIAYAAPACASRRISLACKDYVVSCVMRDDAVPRMSPRAMVSMQEEALALTWGEMAECARKWGGLGRTLYEQARNNKKKIEHTAEDPETEATDTQQEDSKEDNEAKQSAADNDSESNALHEAQGQSHKSNEAPKVEAVAACSSELEDAYAAASHPESSYSSSMLPPSSQDQAGSVVNQPSPLNSDDIDSQDVGLMIPFIPGTVVFLHPMEQYSSNSTSKSKQSNQSGEDASKSRSGGAADSAQQEHQGEASASESESASKAEGKQEQDSTKESGPDSGGKGESQKPDDGGGDTAEGASDKKEKSGKGADKGGKEGGGPPAEVDGGTRKFDRFVVRLDGATLGTMRIHQQGLNDHFLDQYRSGLGMRALPKSAKK